MSDLMSIEQIIESDSGSTPPANPGVETPEESGLSEDSTTVESSEQSLEQIVEEESSQDSDETPEPEVEKEPTEETEVTDEAIDKALADAEEGKKMKRGFFEKSLTHLKGKLTDRETALQTYEQHGTVEDVEKFRKFYDDFHGVEEKDGEFIPKTDSFVKTVLSESPAKAVELVNTLVSSPNPANPSQTIFEALISTPEVEQYFADKLAAANDPYLAEVPEEFQEAYKSLSEAEKENYSIAKDDARDAMLRRAQNDLNISKRENERIQAEQKRSQEIFQQSVQTTIEESFSSVVSQFDESLKQIQFNADANLSAFQAYTVKNAVLTAATEFDRPSGKEAVESLKALGITFPTDVPAKVSQLEQLSNKLAQAKYQKNTPAERYFTGEILTVQKQLIARQNEISAQIAQKFGTVAKQANQQKEALLNQPKSRPEINPSGKENPKRAMMSIEDIVAMG